MEEEKKGLTLGRGHTNVFPEERTSRSTVFYLSGNGFRQLFYTNVEKLSQR